MRRHSSRSTHSTRLERWLGLDSVEQISRSMRGWYGPPIAVHGVPGAVFATSDGDFCGPIHGGGVASFADFAAQRLRRIVRNVGERQKHRSRTEMAAGFSSLSDLISEATTGGKLQNLFFSKTGSVTTSGSNASLWAVGNYPSAGATPSAIPGGSVPTSATAGAIPFVDAAGGDTLHALTIQSQGSAAPNCLILYDRTFHAASVSHNTTSGQTVSGAPNRYTSTAAAGTFASLEVTSALGATAQNCTLTYTDEAGNTGQSSAATAAVSSAVANRIPFASFFLPLAAGDTGLRAVTAVTFSAANTGTSNLFQGKPLAFIPQPVANSMVVMDGINSAFNFVRILDDACLAFLELKGVGSSTIYTGTMTLCSG